jgi:hypothetical protein
MTSHSKTLSSTSPQLIPGRSFACCICLSWRASSAAAPAEGDTDGAGEGFWEEGVTRCGVCAAWEDIVGGIGIGVSEAIAGGVQVQNGVSGLR